MTRLPPLSRTELDAGQAQLYDALIDGPRGRAGDVPLTDDDGALRGPFAVMLVSPDVGAAVQQVGAALRYAAQLDPLTREAAVLLIAARRHSHFEWDAHVTPGHRAGLDDDQLARLHHGHVPDGLPTTTTHALTAVAAMLDHGTLDDATFTATRAALGPQVLAELVWLVGYYSMLALALAVYDLDGQPGPEKASHARPRR